MSDQRILVTYLTQAKDLHKKSSRHRRWHDGRLLDGFARSEAS